ncbi:MAG: uroporphyrinogen decarboxylase [Myxococcales bacterium]|nr:uroporphyrinogen decarboxylase [Myxococcales bacterium]
MSVFLEACRRRPTPYTPVWLMRQAGRYQPEYRALRARHPFVELCRRSDLAAEITLRPVEQLGVDAAILFADILLVLEPLGIGFRFDEHDGPRIDAPIRTPTDVERVAAEPDVEGALAFVMQTVRLVRRELPSSIPLIGFAGAPFTLASYVLEGRGARDWHQTRRFMLSEPAAFDELLRRLTEAVTRYLRAQIAAGCDAVQLFDSWVGALGPHEYERHVLPHVRRLFAALGSEVPRIYFGTGNPALYPLLARSGADVIGVDWRVDLGEAWDRIGDLAVQGNLDPAYLLAPVDAMQQAARRVLDAARGRSGHIFNLGHGVLPSSPVDSVRRLVDFVHEASAR